MSPQTELEFPAHEAKRHHKHRSASRHGAEIQALIPLAQNLAWKAGRDGVTVGDIRLYAERQGLLLPGSGRRLSWLCAVPKAAGLFPTTRRRLCPQPKTRNDQVVYVCQECWR